MQESPVLSPDTILGSVWSLCRAVLSCVGADEWLRSPGWNSPDQSTHLRPGRSDQQRDVLRSEPRTSTFEHPLRCQSDLRRPGL